MLRTGCLVLLQTQDTDVLEAWQLHDLCQEAGAAQQYCGMATMPDSAVPTAWPPRQLISAADKPTTEGSTATAPPPPRA